MGKINKKIIILLGTIIVTIIGFGCVFLFNYFKTPLIDRTLESDAYSYLPVEAKNFIMEYYEETDNILLTEKNKKEGYLYLNPEYIDYLVLSEKEKAKIDENNIPKATIEDFDTKLVSKDTSLPSSYDLRNVGGSSYVAPVRDQGGFGLCWAFSIASSIESHSMIKNNTPYNNSSNAQLIAERVFDYGTASNGIVGYTTPYKTLLSRSLGNGGRFDTTVPLLASGASIWSYDDFKAYSDTDTSTMEASQVLRNDKSKYELMQSDAIGLNTLRESTGSLTDEQKETRQNYIDYVKTNIMTNGSVYFGTHLSNNCIHTDAESGWLFIDVASNSNNNTSCTTTMTDGHAMQIIGWDDNKNYSYCITGNSTSGYYHYKCTSNPNVTGKGAWIVKNSWGNTYSYLYVAYDSFFTELSAIKEIQSSEDRDWDNSYHLGTSNINYDYTNRTYKASDTRVVGNEKLIRVKAYSDVSSANYTLKVVDSNGTYHTYTKTITNAGLFYFDINDNITINNTSTFTLSCNKSSAFLDTLSVFTENTSDEVYFDISPLKDRKVAAYSYMETGTATRYYFNTKNIEDGTAITFKLYDPDGNNITNKLTVGENSNIVFQNGVNALLTFNIANRKGSYLFEVYDGDTLIESCYVIVNSMSGSGSLSDPFVITTPEEFDEIRYGLSSNYIIANTIDFAEATTGTGSLNKASSVCSDGYGFEAIDGFSGSLNGNNKTIKNLRQNNHLTCVVDGNKVDDYNYTGNGVFSNAYGDASINNLIIDNFDINCSGGLCSTLISNYNEYKTTGVDSKLFKLSYITVRNTKLDGKADVNNSNLNLRKVYGGGLLGNINAEHSYVNLGYIYVGYDLKSPNIYNKGLFVSSINGKYTSLYDIQLSGSVYGNKEDSSGDGILNYKINSENLNINRVLATVKSSKVKGNLLGEISGDNVEISDTKTLAIEGKTLCDSESDCSSATNCDAYDLDTEFGNFSTQTNYSTWTDFSSNWTIDTITSINRLPFLKKVPLAYTEVNNINITQVLNTDYNIGDYITPNTILGRNVIAKVADESVLTINNEGKINILKTGSSTVNVKSLYDGLIKDITISVTYTPHYTVDIYPNGGDGDSTSTMYAIGTNYTVPSNTYTYTDHVFKGWNTREDGKGVNYKPGDVIENLEDTNVVKLYAQWKTSTEPSETFTSEVYDIDNDNNTIDLIVHDTTKNTFLSNITYTGYTLDIDTKSVSGKDQLYTGGKVKLYLNNVLQKEYTCIVRGDVNGNATIDIIDYVRIRKDIMDTEKLSGIYLKAADMNKNNVIDIIDYVRIRKIIMEEE